MELKKVRVDELIPYEKNPRKNEAAVEVVMESIRQCEYITPIIVDENMVILAGHTRLKALQRLGETECEVIIKSGLTEEQKKKYRLLDNKTNEFAKWDIDLLDSELDDIDFDGFDFGFIKLDDVDINDFFQEITPVEPTKQEKPEKERKVIKCPHCGEYIEIE